VWSFLIRTLLKCRQTAEYGFAKKWRVLRHRDDKEKCADVKKDKGKWEKEDK
jgi:hypothetical protein